MTTYVDRIEVQFGLAHDCIRACVYGNYIARRESARPAWLSIMDMCYADAVITWNQLFGTDSQHAHWKGFTALLPIPSGVPLKPFGREVICDYIGINEEQWTSYHTSMVRTRNNWLAHFDHRSLLADLPDLTWALHSAYIYRAWLLELLKGYRACGHDIVIGMLRSRCRAAFSRTGLISIGPGRRSAHAPPIADRRNKASTENINLERASCEVFRVAAFRTTKATSLMPQQGCLAAWRRSRLLHSSA